MRAPREGIAKLLEPAAAEWDETVKADISVSATISAAISLKRIADALDGVNGDPQRLRPIEHIAGILWSKS